MLAYFSSIIQKLLLSFRNNSIYAVLIIVVMLVFIGVVRFATPRGRCIRRIRIDGSPIVQRISNNFISFAT
jgi:hypothetical protein